MNYDYECDSCGNVQEVSHGMMEYPEIKCSKCNTVMRRIITGGIGIVFKGCGWASADSRLKRDLTAKNVEKTKKMKDMGTPYEKKT